MGLLGEGASGSFVGFGSFRPTLAVIHDDHNFTATDHGEDLIPVWRLGREGRFFSAHF